MNSSVPTSGNKVLSIFSQRAPNSEEKVNAQRSVKRTLSLRKSTLVMIPTSANMEYVGIIRSR
eukprot:6178858-Pleurochrysis_carterae.AAC.2